MQYKINAIDDTPPREWSGPNGVVYYITVGLDGHQKPVSIGKKTPDALKVGDTVWGDIIPTEFETDKWKGSAPVPSTPTAVGAVFGSKAKPDAPDYEQGTNARWAIKMAYEGYIRTIGYPPEEEDTGGMWAAIELNALKLVQLFDTIKTRGSGDVDTPSSSTPTIKEAVKPATSLGQKFRETRMSTEEANSFLEEMQDEEQS